MVTTWLVFGSYVLILEAFEFSRRVGDVIFLHIGYFIEEVLSNTEGVSLRSANPCGSHSE